jgi:hypothetical protein
LTLRSAAHWIANETLTKKEAEMLDYSEILIRVSQVQRSLTDSLNDKDTERARGLADELLWQARQLQLVLRDE